MIKLTNKEEEIMKILWRLEKGFVKDILNELEEPKPHYNTMSTIVRNLVDKGYVGYDAFGNTHRYHPRIDKESYRKAFINDSMVEFFDDSYTGLVSFFAKEEKISVDELREIIKLIEGKNG
ncbi:MAG: BlaI/MecI/CopY family transcriptional regulator [Eudoraea sp.]|nr:BlaI/MecI/CopY family transcriptional regulator [Eudoraea sp.]